MASINRENPAFFVVTANDLQEYSANYGTAGVELMDDLQTVSVFYSGWLTPVLSLYNDWGDLTGVTPNETVYNISVAISAWIPPPFSGDVTIVADEVGLDKEITQEAVKDAVESIAGEDFATAANQTNGDQKTGIYQGLNQLGINASGQVGISNFPASFNVGNFPSSFGITGTTLTGTSLNINVTNTVTISGSVSISGGTVAITAASLPLPTGAATASLQNTGNNSLATLENNLVPTVVSTTRAQISTTAAGTIKGSAGRLVKFKAFNTSVAIAAYLKLYDVASPTAASTPIEVYVLTAGADTIESGDYVFYLTKHSTAITYRVTRNLANNDNTAPAADVWLTFHYV